MKKALKVITYCLVVLGILALAICYMVIPQQTKSAIDIVVGYLNTPLGIGVGSSLTVGMVVFVVSKYLLKLKVSEIKQGLDNVKQHNTESVVNARNYYEQALVKEQEIKSLINGYQTEIDNLKEQVLELCKTIPNKKVNELGNAIAERYDIVKEQVVSDLENAKNQYVGNLLEKEDKVNELNKKIDELVAKLEKLENKYEREETIND